MSKGRTVSVGERATYAALTERFMAREIVAFSVAERDRWEVFTSEASFAAAPSLKAEERTTYTMSEVRAMFGLDAGKVKRTGKPELVAFLRTALAALPADLSAEAERLLVAA